MNPRRLLARLAAGHFRNVSFRDALALAHAFSFPTSCGNYCGSWNDMIFN
jgi:hypothetical protein